MSTTEYDSKVTAATLNPALRIDPPKLILYPYFDIMTKERVLAAAFVTHVYEGTDPHVVVTSYHVKDGDEQWNIWCGDKFTEGRKMPEPDARERCDAAADGLPNKSKLVTEMMEHYLKSPESERCTFWTTWRRSKELCTHTESVLAHLRDTQPDFRQKLKDKYDAATNGIAPTGTPVGDTMVLEELAFRVPVLFEGERGAGKTVTARAFARTNNFKRIEFGGHEGIESPDMLGYLVPYEKGLMVWKDGPLSEAFRSARKQKTVLIIDELLRIRQRELSILLTALSPDEGVYRLRTGRITEVVDGVAIEEELECPVENLCVVATTNVGAEYAVDEIDPALAERFVIIRKDTTPAELKRILTLVATKLGVQAKAVDAAVEFFKKMTELRNRGMVKHTPTTRTLVRALELSVNQGGEVEHVKRGVRTQVLLWVARNAEGHPVPEQVADVGKLIDRCFK